MWNDVNEGMPPIGEYVELICEYKNYDNHKKQRSILAGQFNPKIGWDIVNYQIAGKTYEGVVYWRCLDDETKSLIK